MRGGEGAGRQHECGGRAGAPAECGNLKILVPGDALGHTFRHPGAASAPFFPPHTVAGPPLTRNTNTFVLLLLGPLLPSPVSASSLSDLGAVFSSQVTHSRYCLSNRCSLVKKHLCYPAFNILKDPKRQNGCY